MKPIHTAIYRVRSGFGLDQNYSSVAPPEFRCKSVADDLKFFYRRKRGTLSVLIFRRIVIVDAVYLKCCASRSGTIEINGGAGRGGRIILCRARILLKPGKCLCKRQK